MRCALLTPRFWPEVRRGTERHVHDLAEGLRAGGHQPVVVTAGRRPGRDGNVVRLPRLRSHLPVVPLALYALRADVAHAFHAGDAAAASLWRGPVVYTHMGIPDAADVAADRWARHAARRSDAVVVLSRHAAEAAAATFGRRPEIIPPGVDLSRFPCGGERTPEPTAVFAAAGDPRKRLGLLLDAWRLVRERHPAARLLVDRRAAPPAQPGVVAVDLDDTARLAAITGAAWAAVLPSVNEAFGLVLVEALATGTPVVATRDGGMPEIVDRAGIGCLFSGGAAELARAIEDAFALAQRPNTRGACRARAAEFDVTGTVQAYAAIYARLADWPDARPAPRAGT